MTPPSQSARTRPEGDSEAQPDQAVSLALARRRAWDQAAFEAAQHPAIIAADDLLRVLQHRSCRAEDVERVASAARSALDRLWETAARVTDGE
jgi:hypothetical protein